MTETAVERAIFAHQSWEERYFELCEMEDREMIGDYAKREPGLLDAIVAAVPVDLADAGRKAAFIADTGGGLDWYVMERLLRSIAPAALPIARAA